MKKVITYGTYDLFHQGHYNLLKRAKELGDFLIVGVTADAFDHARGKINVQQTLMERIEAVKNTGLADEIIVEEYEGQKIDDILRYNVDVFTVGSDWVGKFDYLKEYCEVRYLPRTEGISSSELRASERKIQLKLIGEEKYYSKLQKECSFVNGIDVVGGDSDYDAVYMISHPNNHYEEIKAELLKGKHVLCESPITLSVKECRELFDLAKKQNCVLMPGLKTAYSTAFARLCLLVKSGRIGNVLSIDATCTSLQNIDNLGKDELNKTWNSICAWGSFAMLPVFQILGTKYKSKQIYTKVINEDAHFDTFTKISFLYDHAVASIKVGKGVKSEGELVISGTKGYIYVPAPWWKTDYFELRFENPENNKRYFYQLDGEGIRYELVSFAKAVQNRSSYSLLGEEISLAIVKVIEDYYNKVDVNEL